ncbi:MAG: acetyltransferase [Bacteroidetes bacterium]|nr:MAG: acetyltransferase [Bacteroidota bacterium]
MEIKSLDGIDKKVLYQAFVSAFAGYDAPTPDEAALQTMLARRGFNAAFSFGAFEGGELVSFTFNGTGLYNKIATAYDTGTGTIPEHRKQGLAKRIFIESKPVLISAGIKQYLLEVLQQNVKAVALYQSLGFETVREFDYYYAPASEIKPIQVTTDSSIELHEVSDPDAELFTTFQDFRPSWQNSFEAVQRRPNDFIIITATFKGRVIGYGILEPFSGDITQIAVEHSFRRNGIGTALLNRMLSLNRFGSVKMINIEKTCHSFRGLADSFDWKPAGSQYEMICKL